jgi:inosose dehydratase
LSIRIGTSPDSWGVWFADDPLQIEWPRYLDEVSEAGYRWTELGAFGYLPTDPVTLRRELEQRNLGVPASHCFGLFHELERRSEIEEAARQMGGLLAEVGAKYIVLIDDLYRDPRTGEDLEPAELDDRGWAEMADTVNHVGRLMLEEFGLGAVLHPHADSHVETPDQVDRFLGMTDPRFVNLCLDLGHYEYRGGDSRQAIRDHADRIRYLHLKSVDPAVRDEVARLNPPLITAVAMGIFCEPPAGTPDYVQVKKLLDDVGFDGWATVEQDMYPCDFSKPLPIARRTLAYLNSVGLAD